MAGTATLRRSAATARGYYEPLGYVFMVSMTPRGPMRETQAAAMQDAVEAGEASVDLTYNKIFLEPLTWIAPIWP